MGRKEKTFVLMIVLALVIGVLAKPYLFTTKKTFHVTEQPYQTYQEALSAGKPVFLEFYAVW
ncbi:hypothetical protein CACET_c29150 [Clostridium aceticum]|uniref:Uncharacterized protein n=1 Tax=Clostridium aceticum TaxID=84022 RepID=A0A0D8IA98_9CLOT|nr:hypothetical protein [Clostridium aceticum]AKL96359.1 hypothetical protein CACET_c29150 [Clostridium aceticum]KJF26947.1 hypothetical protein TZ02_10455 [Clostridium aceticum]